MRIGAALVLTVALGSAVESKNVGETAPDFSRADLAGKPVRLADSRGKLVLLNFWASWCGPCLVEMPQFSIWQEKYGPAGLQVIGVSMDDSVTPVKRLLARRPVTYPLLMGDAKLGEEYGGVLGLPLSYLIDGRGRIVARFQGSNDLAAMERQIKALLPAPLP